MQFLPERQIYSNFRQRRKKQTKEANRALKGQIIWHSKSRKDF